MAIKNEPHVSRDIESRDLAYNYRLLDDAILSRNSTRRTYCERQDGAQNYLRRLKLNLYNGRM